MMLWFRLLITFWCLISFTQLFSQKNNIQIYTAYAVGRPDKRYDFLYDQYPTGVAQSVIDNIDKNTPDDEYSIGLGYHHKLNDKVNLRIDLGYAKLVQDFLLPANGNTYFHEKIEPFFWRDRSDYHLIQLNPALQYNLVNKKARLGVELKSMGNVSFRKHIDLYNLISTRWELFSIELYPSFYLAFWRLRASIGMRAIHFKFRDDALANNGKNPDLYNPFKMRFSLSYEILRW